MAESGHRCHANCPTSCRQRPVRLATLSNCLVFCKKTTPYQNILVYLPDGIGLSAIAAVVLRKETVAHRHEIARAAAEKAFEDPRPVRCLVLVYNADAPTLPYNYLMLADRLPASAGDEVGNARPQLPDGDSDSRTGPSEQPS